uniref:interleukin-like EMT inducer domain-containing protein n=1 Tax=Capnocytophaga sp. oral taxon 338 TaxID=710239 RepID=UPI0002E32D18|nr:interleukin-like EMT inducer domain-containing protein [Capnocytophaga sp. oral taxon 338]
MQIHFNSTYIDVLPTDESYRYHSIMGEHTLNLYFALPTYTDIPTGAWCEFANERYTLNQPAKIVKHNTHHFEYTLTMDSEGANLKNYKFRNPNDKTLKFPFTASPRYHIQILVDCLNMIDSGWQVGNCIEASEKLVSYSHNNCLEALEMIAKAFETEYEIIGKTIHLHKVEYFKDNPLPLQYGKGKGFKTGVSRTTEQSRITRLYVQGGERNIDRSKYGNKELLLPKSQEYVYEGVTFVSDKKGLSIAIKNVQNNGFINEQSLDLSHIYPKRKGTISEVFEVDKAKHFYDFTDTSIPQALDFNAMQIKGEKMLIYFESGMLSGREFEVQKYDHNQKRFQLVPKEEDGVTMPNDIFKPAIGDEYSVYNMQMPNAYICDDNTKTGASWEMMKEACKYLYENRADLFTFTGDLDGIWAKKNWVNVGGRLKMGAYINFSDTEFQRTPVAIRIVGLKEYVNNPYSPQIELSNKVQGHSFVSEMRKLQNQEVYFGELNKRTQSLTKRSWRDAQETIKQIEAAFPEYTKSIVPATVQTMMALIGNKSTQFAFVSSKTNPITVPHALYFDKNTKQINAGSGWLKHFTLGTTDINPNRDANSYKYWNIPAFVSGRLDDKAKTYYLYIKASKTAETGEFILSENKIDIEQEAGFYHFLYATVNSEYEGERGIAKLNGFTEITGGQIKTDKITSGNGEQYIHLFDDHIEIKANLKITDGNKTEIKQLINPDLQLLENRLKQYSNENNAKGEIYLRGTGLNRHAAPIIQINGQNIVPDNYRGLYLAVIRRSDLQIIFKQNYDTYGATEERKALANKLKNLNSDVLVTLVSRDSAFEDPYILGTDELKNALIRCGANDDNSKFVSRMPYAFLGIPNIGKGNGIEVYTSTEVNAPYAEIATKIINGTPQGMNSVFNGMLQTAKNATEAYARAQAELTKTQAIANADGKITAAEQRQIQQLQQKLQEAKNFAKQKVDELNIGSRNLLRNSGRKITNNGYLIATYDITTDLKEGEIVTATIKGKLGMGKAAFALYNSGDRVEISTLKDVGNGIYKNTFSWRIGGTNNKKLWIWIYPSNVVVDSTIEWVKLERGNKATDWSPAPEDVWDTMVDLGIIDKNAAAINEAEKANIKYINGIFSKGADYTNGTEIVKNTITTGAITVGNTLGGNAGINGAGLAGNSIRLFAGKPYSQKEQAPFRVDDNGELWATNAHISGQIDAASGRIGQFYINTENNDNKGQLFSGDNNSGGNAINYSGIFLKNLNEQTEIHLSSSPIITQNRRGFLDINYKGENHNTIGSNITVRPRTDNEFQKYSLAQKIDGNIFTIGQRAIFDDGYMGLAESYAIINNIRHTHTYIFTSVASNRHTIYLPNHSQIIQITGKSNVTFEVTIIMAYSVGGSKIVVQGVANGYILDNDGGHAEGGDGYIEMARGDTMRLRFCEGNYYIVSLRR